jgi:multidrug efflux pump subunit AcrB
VDNGVRIIAFAITVITLTALLFSLTLLPPLLLWDINSNKTKCTKRPPLFIRFFPDKLLLKLSSVRRQFSRRLGRLLAFSVRFCTHYPIVVLSACSILVISAIFALLGKGVDTSSYGSEDSLYAQVEFDGGLLSEEVDRLLAIYSEQLSSNSGIKNVETGARTGSGSMLISFDPKQTKPHLVRELAKRIPVPGGFVFFHENSAKDRYWEIKIYGDEDIKCRELAEELANISVDHPLIQERVLNFKPGMKKMFFLPDRQLFASAGISFSNAAAKVRQGVYGPVAYKKIDERGETDVRIITGRRDFSDYGTNSVMRQSREGTLGILVSTANEETINAIPVESLMRIREETEPSSIRRDDRRRTASITITTKPADPRRIRQELLPLFEKLNLPPGYSVEFDPEAIRQANDLSITVLSLILSIIFCYMIIASINESFTVPLIVLAVIPPSLSIPALCLTLSNSAYNMAVACAFIAVSGMTVNASVLCVDGLRRLERVENTISLLNIYLALRKKMPALLYTTATTIACAFPFLFLKEGANTLIRTMSLVGVLGVTSSFLFSITVIPSLLIIFKKLPNNT